MAVDNTSIYVGNSTTERERFEALLVAANAEENRYYRGTDFTVSYPLPINMTVDVHYNQFVLIDGDEPMVIFQGKKKNRGFLSSIHVVLQNMQTALNGKQNSLSASQLDATNSGITEAKVLKYDGYEQDIANKAEITSLDDYFLLSNIVSRNTHGSDNVLKTKVPSYYFFKQQLDTKASINQLNSKQDALTESQMAAVNSGMTNDIRAILTQYKEVVKNSLSVIASKTIKLHQVMVGILVSENNQETLKLTRRCAEGITEGISAFCSEPFIIDAAKYEFMYANTLYDFYFAIFDGSDWKLAKNIQNGIVAVVSVDDMPWAPGFEPQSENENEDEEDEEDETPTSTQTTIVVPYGNEIGEMTVADWVSTQGYEGCPCVIIATRKNGNAISSADISNFKEVKAYVKITAKDKLQNITDVVNKFNVPKWECQNVPNKELMSQMFEVFPQFEQNAEISDDGYPVGYDHYFAVYMDDTNGTYELDFRMYDGYSTNTVYVRLYVLGVNQYEKVMYLPNVGNLEIIDEDNLLAYVNDYPTAWDVVQDTVVCLHNNVVVFGAIDHTVTEEVYPVTNNGGTITGTGKDPND